jgi:hypothetical protein
MVDTLAARKYRMVINPKDKSATYYCELNVTDVKNVNDNKFEIEMEGKD